MNRDIYRHRLPHTTNQILILLAFAWLTGMQAVGGDGPGATNEPQYTIEGVLTEFSTEDLPAGTLKCDFKVVVNGRQWILTVTPWEEFYYITNGSAVSPVRLSQSEVMSCDGTTSYYVAANSVHAQQSEIKGEAEFATSTAPIRGRRGLMSVWYAFASHSYLQERQDNIIRPIDIVAARPLPLAKATVLELIAEPPGLPKAILIRREYPSQRDETYWKVDKLTVTSVTNVGAYTFPAKVDVEFSDSTSRPKGWYRLELMVKSVAMVAENTRFVPLLKGVHRITYRDIVVRSGPNQAQQGLTIVTNAWPSVAAYGAEAKQTEKRSVP